MNSVSPIRTEAQELFTYSMKHALKYQSSIRNLTTSITKVIKDEPVVLARLGFVVSCSLGGWVLGYKSRSFRKLVYASICGSVATVVSFPSGSVSNVKHAFDFGSNKLSEVAKRFSLNSRASLKLSFSILFSDIQTNGLKCQPNTFLYFHAILHFRTNIFVFHSKPKKYNDL
ncbi:unnamed protein product [Schistosoma mattheei]|uniref:MICOS complex subunit n=1 Tax=Schistosoma mattheei TaxID=31246 RepID=A0AA85BRC9_9TREM|nr:unnamed protein product [Schistosoma mattheei]